MTTNATLHLEAGATYSVLFEYETEAGEPIDISDYTAEFQIRKSVISEPALVTKTPEIVANAMTIEMSAAETGSLINPPYVYGIELYRGEEVVRFAEGVVTVSPEVVK